MPVFLLGIAGAALFYGDAHDHAGDLGAVGGRGAEARDAGASTPYVVPITVAILIALFIVQRHGHGQGGGASSARSPRSGSWSWPGWACSTSATTRRSCAALSPHYAAGFLVDHGLLGFVILGSVFLAVTGAEALYADMGHFGRGPIRAAWLGLVLPAPDAELPGPGRPGAHAPRGRRPTRSS